MRIFVIFLIYFLCPNYVNCKIKALTDDEIIDHIRNDERFIVLYTKKNCDECDKYESMFDNLSLDFKEHLNANVAKAINSPMCSLFSPNKEPAIVYYRRGLPLLYYGPLSEEAIINNFYDNPEPIVKELSDENFEHLTQSSTGATTGDWFIFFYTTDCSSCQRIHACWEAVGAALKQRMNIARINIQGKGKLTGKRFEIDSVPQFVFFRHGKLYRYKHDDNTPAAFIAFATEGYKDVRAENVVKEYTEPIYQKLFEFLTYTFQQPYIIQIFTAFIIVSVILFILMKFKSKKTAKKEKTKKQK